MVKPGGRLAATYALATIGLYAAAFARPITPPWCRPTDDILAQRFIAQLLQLATSDDSNWVAARQALQAMPKADSSAVYMIAEDSLCHLASAALDSGLYAAPHGYPVYLAHVGVRYVAFPPADSVTHMGTWVHMDSTFRVLMWSSP
jgi:hypothetical protein